MSNRTSSKAMALEGLISRQKTDRRRGMRYTLKLMVQVAGVDDLQRHWREATETINVSSGGAALRMTLVRQVMVGDILHIEVTIPPRLLMDTQASPTHRGYATVRYVQRQADGQQVVRLQFIGAGIPMR